MSGHCRKRHDVANKTARPRGRAAVPIRRLDAQKTTGLAGPEPRIYAVLLEQIGMPSLLHDTPPFQHDDPIHTCNRRETVRDRHNGLAFHEAIKRVLNSGLDF